MFQPDSAGRKKPANSKGNTKKPDLPTRRVEFEEVGEDTDTDYFKQLEEKERLKNLEREIQDIEELQQFQDVLRSKTYKVVQETMTPLIPTPKITTSKEKDPVRTLTLLKVTPKAGSEIRNTWANPAEPKKNPTRQLGIAPILKVVKKRKDETPVHQAQKNTASVTTAKKAEERNKLGDAKTNCLERHEEEDAAKKRTQNDDHPHHFQHATKNPTSQPPPSTAQKPTNQNPPQQIRLVEYDSD